MSGDPAPSREAGAGVAGSAGPGFERAGTLGPRVSRLPLDEVVNGAAVVAHAVTSREAKGPDSDCTSGLVLAHTLRAEGHDASEDGRGRGTPLVVSESGKGWWSEGAGPLRADPGGMPSHIAFDTTQVPSKANRSNPKPGDPCHPLSAGAHPPALAQAITAEMYRSGGATAGNNPGERNVFGAIPRRLTPRECERLQGFPDDWTRYADDGSGLADSPRYRMLGNAVTVSVAEWIGSRLALEPHP
jgi:DNA (cytosine-5)-methyltransferase 1